MSEEKNIEDTKPEVGNTKYELKDDPSQQQSLTQPETPNSKPESVSMEVHKHPNHVTHKKKWTEYLLEFLMLFLAVFLGFVAENIREHNVEKERAEQLAISFYDELKGDSATFHTVLKNRIRKDIALDYLKKYFRDSSLIHCSKMFAVNFFYGFATYSPSVFEPRDAILEQLKNSGSLRYFKSVQLQKLTGNLSVTIANIRSRNQIELNFTQQRLLPFVIEHNDQSWSDSLSGDNSVYLSNAVANYENSTKEISFRFNNAEGLDRTIAVNLVGLYQIIFRGSWLKQYRDYEMLNAELLKELRKEYHLENE